MGVPIYCSQDIGKIVLSFTEPGIILQVRIDKRFDAVRQDDGLEKFLDLESAADRYIAELERLVEEWPKYANGYVLYSRALLGSWRYEDVLGVIEPIALKIREPNANELFTDARDNTNWVLEAYATALYFERYPEKSEDMFEEAVEVPEVGDINVNQRLNLAGSLVFGGHFDQAMELLGKLGNTNTNPFGRMWVNSITVCANAMRENPQDYSPSLTYLIAHEIDNPSALTQALLCTNELASAAQHLIRRLENPDQRMVALLYLQHRKGNRIAERKTHKHVTMAGLTPGHILKHRLDQLRERRILVDAIDQVGRIEEVPLHSSVWLRY
jgi:tetratricopeptide (TPR) repeat protein